LTDAPQFEVLSIPQCRMLNTPLEAPLRPPHICMAHTLHVSELMVTLKFQVHIRISISQPHTKLESRLRFGECPAWV
jgi:hypothetical protein